MNSFVPFAEFNLQSVPFSDIKAVPQGGAKGRFQNAFQMCPKLTLTPFSQIEFDNR